MTLLVNNAATDLVLTGIGVQPYSARGLTQTLEAIQQAAQLKRTVNGLLRDLSLAQFKKYSSSITGNDQLPPVCDGIWPGKEVTVDCVVEMSSRIGQPKERTMVPDSEYEQGGFLIWRPRLFMRVTSVSWDRAEYDRVSNWTMTLEEI